MPHMREIRTDEHEVAAPQPRDVVADHAVPAALQHKRELILRVNMPRRMVARSTHDLAVEGLPLRSRRFFEDGFHLICRGAAKKQGKS